jgi:2-hydroxychromene-2-carboxylate isomerase
MADPRLTRAPAVFYYDLGSPAAYLAAERVVDALGGVPEFVPVRAGGLPDGEPPAFRCEHEELAWREDVARRAQRLGLQAIRWPATVPPDAERALRVATFAKEIGRVVAFSLAAMRQAWAGGRDLSDPDTVLLAAAACEMHPAAVTRAWERPAIVARLDGATAAAAAAGVRCVPAVRVGATVFHGEEALDAAAAA